MDQNKKKILIVDDNEFFLKQQISFLDAEKYTILTANSGNEALEKISSTIPDLILLDHIMQDMTGPKLCRIIKSKEETAHIPVIIVSSGERNLSRKETLEAGSDGLIFKPIRREQLLSLVEEYLGSSFRRWARVSVSLACEVRGEEAAGEGTILSLGAGGVFLTGGPSFLRGDTCQLRFSLPESTSEISVREAMVVWIGQVDSEGPVGTGMKFITISGDDQTSIDRYAAGVRS